MKNKGQQLFALSAMILLILAFSGMAGGQETEKPLIERPVMSWLLLGPFPSPLPAFNDDAKKTFDAEDMIKFEEIDISKLRPSLSGWLLWRDGMTAGWKTVQAGEKGIILPADTLIPSAAYLGVYIDVKRWTKAKVTVKSSQLFQVYVDGENLASKTQSARTEKGASSAEGKKSTADLKLETGKHLLLLKTVFDPKSGSDWTVEAALAYEEKFAAPSPSLTLSPEQNMTIKHLLDEPQVTAVSISPDGALAALSKSQSLAPDDDSENWIEIYDVEKRRLLDTYRGDMAISRVNWAPLGKKFSYTSRGKSGSTIWIVDLEAGTSVPVLKNIKDLGDHIWAPDARFIIYSVTEKGEAEGAPVKRFQNLADRQPGWRNRSYLYRLSLPDGIRQRLSAGELSTSFNGISPDGKKLLFTRSLVDYSQRPYSKTELCVLDLASLTAEKIWEGNWFGGAEWTPDGGKLLVFGGPSAFGNVGVNAPKGTIPNEYDTQAYFFDPKSKAAESLTRDFNPSVDRAFWSETENCVYFVATDRSYRRLFRCDPAKKEFSPIDCEVEVIEQIDIARKKPLAVYSGSGPASPPKAFILDITKAKSYLLEDPAKEGFAEVKFGEVKPWTFKNKRGREIEGDIYFPPGFDPSAKYPCIVYYYGGTTPVTREFGGRYPKDLYAAQGYIVYVLQPSGATGFGQDFSALHVNDWGLIVADEIIDGVKKFLTAHPFVDARRVGCIGASYGGFMTMLLLTRTNIFSAAVAHAGISSISSYWGEGYWGYAYSAIAAANSFPWNRKDIYVNQSPLFSADKITTPLLLLHGSADSNVPPGESTQLYTALKILGREVEYIQVLDQDHHIMTHSKRIIWTKTILAWFDKWLKGQPEWWNSLYLGQ